VDVIDIGPVDLFVCLVLVVKGLGTVYPTTYLPKCKTTVIQDDPSENVSAKGKCIYPYLRQTPKIKYLLRKIFCY